MSDRREGIPHVPDLAAERMAEVVAWSETKSHGRTPAAYRLRPAGQQLIYEAMARNAELARTDPTQAPHRLVFTSGGSR